MEDEGLWVSVLIGFRVQGSRLLQAWQLQDSLESMIPAFPGFSRFRVFRV